MLAFLLHREDLMNFQLQAFVYPLSDQKQSIIEKYIQVKIVSVSFKLKLKLGK